MISMAEQTVFLSKEQARKPLGEFYKTVAKTAGYMEDKHTAYDCTRILVAPDVQDAIIESYRELCPEAPMEAITMLLAMGGPKVDSSLGTGEVLIMSGFIRPKEET